MSSPWTPSRPDAALRAAHCDCWNVSRVDLSRSDRIGNDRSNDNTADAGNTVFSPCCTVRASDEHKTNTATKKEKRVQALHGDQEEEINKELWEVQKKDEVIGQNALMENKEDSSKGFTANEIAVQVSSSIIDGKGKDEFMKFIYRQVQKVISTWKYWKQGHYDIFCFRLLPYLICLTHQIS